MTETATRSSANRVALAFVEEAIQGTTPSNPAMQSFAYTGTPSMDLTPVTVESQAIRADRQRTRVTRAGSDVAGEVAFEMAFEGPAPLLRAAMFSDFENQAVRSKGQVTAVTSSAYTFTSPSGTRAISNGDLIFASGFKDDSNNGLFVAASATNTSVARSGLTADTSPGTAATLRVVGHELEATVGINAAGDLEGSSGDVDFTKMRIAPGDWIRIGDDLAGGTHKFSNSALNGWRRVSAVTATKLSFDRGKVATADTDSDKLIRIYLGDRIINGTKTTSFTWERRFLDHIPVSYQYFKGMTTKDLTLTFADRAVVTSTCSFIGTGYSGGATRATGATDIEAPSEPILTTTADVARVAIGDDPVAGPNFGLNVGMTMTNNLAAQTGIGYEFAVGTLPGQFGLTGEVNTYFSDRKYLALLEDNADTSFDIRLKSIDDPTRMAVFDAPFVKLTSGPLSVTAVNTDVMLNLGYSASMSPTFGHTLLYQRFHHVPTLT